MASYTVIGHIVGRPLPTDISQTTVDAMQAYGVGATITITLPGPEDTAIKKHGALK